MSRVVVGGRRRQEMKMAEKEVGEKICYRSEKGERNNGEEGWERVRDMRRGLPALLAAACKMIRRHGRRDLPPTNIQQAEVTEGRKAGSQGRQQARG